MAKAPPQAPSPIFDDQGPPPPYAPPPPATLSSLTPHLDALPALLHTAAAAAVSARSAAAASLCVAHVWDFIGQLQSAAPAGLPAPRLAELVLVPAAAVPAGWALSGAAERAREGELVRVARVEAGTRVQEEKEKGRAGDAAGDGRPGGGLGFDGWGRWDDGEGPRVAEELMLWWRDEGMARRVAAFLRPPPNVQRRHVQAVVEKKTEERRGWRWGGRASASPVAKAPMAASSRPGAGKGPGDVMAVRDEEVTFRRENELGLWESLSGFAVVIALDLGKA